MRSNAGLFRSMSRAEERMLAAVMTKTPKTEKCESIEEERIAPRLTFTLADAMAEVL